MGRLNKQKSATTPRYYRYNRTPVIIGPKITMVIPPNVWQRMWGYVLAAPGEISGLCKTRTDIVDGQEVVTILDVKIFKQTVSGASTVLEEEMLHKFLFELIKADEDIEQWRLWWHSHYNFGVYWSTIDDEAIAKLTPDPTVSWLSLCVNRAGDTTARKDSGQKCISNNFDIQVEKVPADIYAECVSEVAEKVTKEIIRYGCIKFSKTKHAITPGEILQPLDDIDWDWWNRLDDGIDPSEDGPVVPDYLRR